VTVSGHRAKLFLANRTQGISNSKVVHARQIDLTSAEWAAEAPSACDASGCHTLPLADFGSVSFSGARATTTTGHAGPIADPAWSATVIALSPKLAFAPGVVLNSAGAGAAPGGLSANGDGFTVTYPGPPAPTAPPAEPAAPVAPAATAPPAPPDPSAPALPIPAAVPPLAGAIPSPFASCPRRSAGADRSGWANRARGLGELSAPSCARKA
jgi:hypothetical protein